MSKKYTADDIKVLSGLEPVRLKPGMYIGTTDSQGKYQAVKEIIDNCRDEWLAEANDLVAVMIDGDMITVWDNGRGIPVEKHKQSKKSTLETIFTTLHAGGKLEKGGAYSKGSSGTHGVGASVTNALSESFSVCTYRGGKWYGQNYKRGKPTTKVVVTKPKKLPEKVKKGTIIEFKLDSQIFGKSKLDTTKVKETLELMAYLHGGLRCVYYKSPTASPKTYYQPKGTKALLKRLFSEYETEALNRNPFVYQQMGLDVVMQWTTYSEESLQGYVCGSYTVDGGTHMDGFYDALKEAIDPYRGKAKFKPEDLRVGLLGILNLTIQTPSFEGQTKSKLSTKEARSIVFDQLKKPLTQYFKENKTLAKTLISRAVEIRGATEAFKLSKKEAAALNNKSAKASISTKLARSLTKDPKQRELFIVEGDSAGGTAKQARDTKFQEVLALGGKPLNVYGNQAAKAGLNERVLDILRSIGFDPKSKDPVQTLRIGKIVLLCDPDVDGYHITNLLLSILHKTVPQVFDEGMVYMVDSMLYMGQYKGLYYFGKDLKDLMKKSPKGMSESNVTRIKGWGEINAAQLEPIAFNPESRQLVQILAPKDKKGHSDFIKVVGAEGSRRKELLGIDAGAI